MKSIRYWQLTLHALILMISASKPSSLLISLIQSSSVITLLHLFHEASLQGCLVLDDLDCANRVDADFLDKRVAIAINGVRAECGLVLTHFLLFRITNLSKPISSNPLQRIFKASI